MQLVDKIQEIQRRMSNLPKIDTNLDYFREKNISWNNNEVPMHSKGNFMTKEVMKEAVDYADLSISNLKKNR